MSTYTRRNAWNNNGTFENPDLYWYAKGVAMMQSRALNDHNSWWFFAAIHGEYVSRDHSLPRYPGWGHIPSPPHVPTSPLPSQGDINTYWNQCQHQSWYFLPWHRGYLIALEEQIRKAIIDLKGPETWALPYWNYLGPGDEYKMPPAFAQEEFEGGTNPLYVNARYGPNNDHNIFIKRGIGRGLVNGNCMSNNLFTGSNSVTPKPGFGGPETGFHHGRGASGNLEQNPHNFVHVQGGGHHSPPGTGLMGIVAAAALDPIFYLHHCNIDRMWAVWNANGNVNPSSSKWLDGPAAVGDQRFKFIMPMPPNGTPWIFTPANVSSLDSLNYTYEGLQASASQIADTRNPFSIRLARLGVPVQEEAAMPTAEDAQYVSELVGAHDGAIQLDSAGARVSVGLDSEVHNKVIATLKAASVEKMPDRVYLQIENVRGTNDGNILHINVNDNAAESVALFGLHRASLQDGEHGGSGLTFIVDITDIIDAMHMRSALEINSLDVMVMPEHPIPEDSEISIGRISVYREGHS